MDIQLTTLYKSSEIRIRYLECPSSFVTRPTLFFLHFTRFFITYKINILAFGCFTNWEIDDHDRDIFHVWQKKHVPRMTTSTKNGVTDCIVGDMNATAVNVINTEYRVAYY